MNVSWLLFFLLAAPVVQAASCDKPDLLFEQALSQEHYSEALHRVLDLLRVAPTDQARFILDPQLALRVPDVHAQSDPDARHVLVDPALLQEGLPGACQGLVHELAHLHHFSSDWAALENFYRTQAPSPEGWQGCENTPGLSPAARGYDCLEDNTLLPHASAYEIEAVLAQTEVSNFLRSEDLEYLEQSALHFYQSRKVWKDSNNQNYYLATLKKEDLEIYCRGLSYLGKIQEPVKPSWATLCGRSI